MVSRIHVCIMLALANCLLMSNSMRLASAQTAMPDSTDVSTSNNTPPSQLTSTTDSISDDTTSSQPEVTDDSISDDTTSSQPEVTDDSISDNTTSSQPEVSISDGTMPPRPTTATSSTPTTSKPTTSPSTAPPPTTPPPTTPPSTTPPPTAPRDPSFTGFTYFNFSILFYAPWNDMLTDPKSDEYQRLANDTATSLKGVYINASAPGYSDIIVDRFTNSSGYNATSSFGTRSNMNMFGNDAVIAYYRAQFTTEAAFTQIAAIEKALAEIQKDLVDATIAGFNTSEAYLNDVMAAEITANTAEVNKSKSNYCESSADVCQPYEMCSDDGIYNTSSGIACVPGCYQKCTDNKQVCTYQNYTAPVCSCQDNYATMGDSCVSVGLIIGLAAGIGVIIIATLIVILVIQSRKMKHIKSTPAAYKGQQLDDFDDVFSKKPTAPSTNLAFEEESALHTAADDSSSSNLSENLSPVSAQSPAPASAVNASLENSNTPQIQPSKDSLMAALINSDEFKNYRPSFAGIDTNKKFVLKRTFVDD